MRNKTCSITIKNLHEVDRAFSMFVYNNCMRSVSDSGVVECSYNVLLNKFNPDNETHKPSFNEVVKTAAHTGDLSILESGLSVLGYGIHKKEHEHTESSMLHCVLSSVSASANITGLYDTAMADGVLDNRERKQMLDAVSEAEKKLKELRAKLTVKAA